MKTYYETTKNGREKVIEKDNGIIIRCLVEPSDWYIEKSKERINKIKQMKLEKTAKKLIESRIKERASEIAKQQLIEEGILNKDGTLNE